MLFLFQLGPQNPRILESAGEGLGLAVDQGIHLAECLQQGGACSEGVGDGGCQGCQGTKDWGTQEAIHIKYISYFPIGARQL